MPRALADQHAGRARAARRRRAGGRAASAPVSYGRTLTVDADRQGHFEVEARIDGRFVDFMVDTGASLVILRETDAANAGMRPMPRDYTATVSTANGKIKAAPAKIGRIEVGGITSTTCRRWCCRTTC